MARNKSIPKEVRFVEYFRSSLSFLKDGFKQMGRWQWILPIFLLFAPLSVTLAQLSILDFPDVEPLLGQPYTPFPQILYFPIRRGVVLMTLGILTMFTFPNQWYLKQAQKKQLAIFLSLLFVNTTHFWFGIVLAQRTVILAYLNSINANGLHFFRAYMLPLMPEVFPNDGTFPFRIALLIGTVGLAGIFSQYFVLYRKK